MEQGSEACIGVYWIRKGSSLYEDKEEVGVLGATYRFFWSGWTVS